jgi:hypothetical protein
MKKHGSSGRLHPELNRLIMPKQLRQYMTWKAACWQTYEQIWNSALTLWAKNNASGATIMPDDAEYVRLRNEYHITQRVLAAVLELYLKDHGGGMLELTDEYVLNAPSLVAFRDEPRKMIALRVERD